MRTIFVVDAHTNGHEAALKFMRSQRWHKNECNLIFCGNHANVLSSLSKGPSYAVVPVNNSIAGDVEEVLKDLSSYRERGYSFDEVARADLQINHCLLAAKHVKS